MEAVCRRRLPTQGEYSFVSRASLTECLGKVAMLELLKAEGSAWAAILACKAPREDTRAFEKKVKSQFSLVPFEEVTPVVQEVALDSGEAAEEDGSKEAANGKDKSKEEDEVMEVENWARWWPRLWTRTVNRRRQIRMGRRR